MSYPLNNYRSPTYRPSQKMHSKKKYHLPCWLFYRRRWRFRRPSRCWRWDIQTWRNSRRPPWGWFWSVCAGSLGCSRWCGNPGIAGTSPLDWTDWGRPPASGYSCSSHCLGDQLLSLLQQRRGKIWYRNRSLTYGWNVYHNIIP